MQCADPDGSEVEQADRQREHDHRDRIGSRGHHRREHERRHHCPAPPAGPGPRLHEAREVDRDQDDGQQEGEPERQDETHHEAEVGLRIDVVDGVLRRELGEQRHGVRQSPPREVGAHQEQGDGRGQEAHRIEPLLARQSWGDEGPELVQPPGAGQQDAEEERHLDLHVERRRDTGEVQRDLSVARGARLDQRFLQGGEHAIVEHPTDDPAHEQADHGKDQALAQLSQVCAQRHAAARGGAARTSGHRRSDLRAGAGRRQRIGIGGRGG
ncbi:hypothetical protein GALL_345530 [mine drainage metagenome]|uniref:Uncharacterized protein n=1 Tax=mine drainage metagenome TaxID=410659 RepID=A0A1J5QJJ6_9ZZZZ